MFNTLNLETLRRRAPSIFTEDSAKRTSDKYQHISTAKVIEGLMGEGFMPTLAVQCGCRLKIKQAYTKHMIRFRHVDARPTVSGLYPELVLINSHDGLSSYRLISGVFRIVCSNGLIAGTTYGEIRVRHQGDIMRDVIEGTYEVIENSRKMISASDDMAAIELDDREKKIFAEAAHSIRFENSDIGKEIEPIKLLSPRRSVERKNDLFTVFNVVQENTIKGGLRGYGKDKRGYPKRITTRAVTSIDHNTTINRALWSLAEKMMELRKG